MHLLFISLTMPVPANNGYKMRAWAMLRALAAEGHRITLLAFCDPAEQVDRRQLEQVCERVVSVPMRMSSLSGNTDYAGRLRSLFSAQPYAVSRFASPPMRNAIAELAASAAYDAVFCETVYGLVNVPPLNIPIVLDHHNVEHRILERYARFEHNPLKRLYARQEARRLREIEHQAGARAAVAVCCSDVDRQVFAALNPQARLSTVPNVVEVEGFLPFRNTPEEPLTVLYQGGMDWFPNRDAVRFFVESILPTIRQAAPGVRLVVGGRSPSPEFRRQFAEMPDVQFTGTVADMKPVVAKAAVCVVPLRIGSGTRLKILESAAMAKPVVSTTVGAEGLDFRDRQEIVIADSPREFAANVIALLKDAGLRAQLGRAARECVERCYSFAVLRRTLSAALADCAAKPFAHTAVTTSDGEISKAAAEQSCQTLSRQEAVRN